MKKLILGLSVVASAIIPHSVYSQSSNKVPDKDISSYIHSKIINRNNTQKIADEMPKSVTHALNVSRSVNLVQSRAAAPGGDFGGEADERLINKDVLARIKVDEAITPESTELLGDKIGLAVGSVSFSHTDIAIPGNNGLEVAIRRSFKGSNFAFGARLDMADWVLDIPHIQTTLLSKYNQTTREMVFSGDWGRGRECSGSLYADDFYGYLPYEFWNGDTLNIPGLVNEKLLANTTGV